MARDHFNFMSTMSTSRPHWPPMCRSPMSP